MPEPNVPTLRGKGARITLLALTALPALGMFLAGMAKFFPASRWRDWFADWGYPRWFAFVIGGVEMAAAVLAVIPRFAFYGATVIAVVMTSASITLYLHRDGPPGWKFTGPIVYVVIFAAVAALRWKERARMQ